MRIITLKPPWATSKNRQERKICTLNNSAVDSGKKKAKLDDVKFTLAVIIEVARIPTCPIY